LAGVGARTAKLHLFFAEVINLRNPGRDRRTWQEGNTKGRERNQSSGKRNREGRSHCERRKALAQRKVDWFFQIVRTKKGFGLYIGSWQNQTYHRKKAAQLGRADRPGKVAWRGNEEDGKVSIKG